MNVLFIDTACRLSHVHYSNGYKTVENCGEKSHSVNLLPMIEQVLGGDKLKDIDVIGVTNGPGSYTGIRIGVATAKTLAWSLGKPLVAVNTLDYIAQSNVPESGDAELVVPLIDARNNQAFYSFYKAEKGVLTRVCDYSAGDIGAIKEKAYQISKKTVFCGDGAKNVLGIDNDFGNCEAAVSLVTGIYNNENDKTAFDPDKANAYYMKEVHVTLKNNGQDSV